MKIRANDDLFFHPDTIIIVSPQCNILFWSHSIESKSDFVNQLTHASQGGRASQAAVQSLQEKAAILASHFLLCSHARVLYLGGVLGICMQAKSSTSTTAPSRLNKSSHCSWNRSKTVTSQ
jgi:hypothetical protein